MRKLDNIPTETLSMNFFCNSCSSLLSLFNLYEEYACITLIRPREIIGFSSVQNGQQFFRSYNTPQCVIEGKWRPRFYNWRPFCERRSTTGDLEKNLSFQRCQPWRLHKAKSERMMPQELNKKTHLNTCNRKNNNTPLVYSEWDYPSNYPRSTIVTVQERSISD